MRYGIALLLTGLCGAAFVGESQAQVRTSSFKPVQGLYGRPAWVTPYVGSPYYNVSAVRTPYGYTATFNATSTARPLYAGPYHTIYFDPLANTYRYTTGYANTPTYSFSYTDVNPYLANPYLSNPYLTNPYLYGNPYLLNPYLP